MLEHPGLGSFPVKALQHLGVTDEPLGQRLDRHFPTQLTVGGAVDAPHTSATQRAADLILPYSS